MSLRLKYSRDRVEENWDTRSFCLCGLPSWTLTLPGRLVCCISFSQTVQDISFWIFVSYSVIHHILVGAYAQSVLKNIQWRSSIHRKVGIMTKYSKSSSSIVALAARGPQTGLEFHDSLNPYFCNYSSTDIKSDIEGTNVWLESSIEKACLRSI